MGSKQTTFVRKLPANTFFRTPLREKEIKWCAKKLLGIRLFEEGDKHWKKNVKDEDLELLVVSQFTLYSGKTTPKSFLFNNCSVLKGNKPDFHNAMGGEQAKKLFDLFLSELSAG